jgi:soluble lytic murein transglycosylase
MPKVPVYSNPTVDVGVGPQNRAQAFPIAAPTPFQPSGATEVTQVPGNNGLSPEMATLGTRQIQAFGAAGEKLGTSLGQIAIDAQREANTLRVDDAKNKAKEVAMRLAYEQDGFVNAKGLDALERKSGMTLADEYSDKLKKEIESITAGLGNTAQKQSFGMQANDLLTSFRGQATQHESGEFKTYALSVRDGTIRNSMNNIGINYNNPGIIDNEIKSIAAATFDMARLQGKSATWAEAETRKMTSNAHKIALATALEKNDIQYASGYLNKYRSQMDADDILQVDGLLTKDIQGRIALAAGNSALGSVQEAVSNDPVSRLSRLITPPGSNTSTFASPIDAANLPTVSSTFGPRKNPFTGSQQHHDGVDYAVPIGTPIRAAGSGTVVKVGNEPSGYGNFIEIKHADGSISKYAHASGFNYKEGDTVGRGDVIGASGNSGRSTGPHLHFEIRGADGKLMNPSTALSDSGANGAALRDNLRTYADTGTAIAATLFGEAGIKIAIARVAEINGVDSKQVTADMLLPHLKKEEQATLTQTIKSYESGGGRREVPALNTVLAQVKAQTANSPLSVQTAALEVARKGYADLVAAEKQAADDRVKTWQGALVKNGGDFSSLPLSIKAQIDPDKRDDALEYARKIHRGPDVSDDTVINKYLYDVPALLKLSEPEFMLLRSSASRSDFDKLADLRKTGIKEAADVNTGFLNNYIEQSLSTIGVKLPSGPGDTSAKVRVELLKKIAIDEVMVQQSSAGRKLTDKDLMTVVDQLVMKAATNDKSFWFFGGNKIPLLSFEYGDIPSTDRDRIKRKFTDQGLQKPEDAMVLSIFLKEQLAKK